MTQNFPIVSHFADGGLLGGVNDAPVIGVARNSRSHLKVLFITDYAESEALSNAHLDPGCKAFLAD